MSRFAHVTLTSEPRTVSEIYRDLTGLPETARLSADQKKLRRRLAGELERMATAGTVQCATRSVDFDGRPTVRVEFWA